MKKYELHKNHSNPPSLPDLQLISNKNGCTENHFCINPINRYTSTIT